MLFSIMVKDPYRPVVVTWGKGGGALQIHKKLLFTLKTEEK